MALAAELLEQLKIELKQSGLTYRDVADSLSISDSSVKRLFRERDMSLTRLESICELVNLDIRILTERCDQAKKHVMALTWEQEQTLVGDEILFLIATHIIYGWSFRNIMDSYQIDEHKAQQHLTTLDRMKVIELLPDNHARVLLSPDFEWIKNGPIQSFFEDNLQGSFLQSDFTGSGELRLVVNAWISLENITAFHENMRRLVREFETHKVYDKHTPPKKRRGTTLLLAIRPWALELFDKHLRD